MSGAGFANWRQDSSYKWALIGMLWFVCFFNYADRQAIFSVFPLLKDQLHLSNVQLGIIGGAFTWMYALFGPFAGSLCDRFPRKTLILGALIFWSLITAATSICRDYSQLIAVRALSGLGEAFYFPAAMSLISDYHGADTRSRAMSWHQSGVYAGTIAGGSLSGFFGQYYGWQSSFVFFGSGGILLAIIYWALLREPARGMSESVSAKASESQTEAEGLETQHAGGLLQGLREVLRNPAALLLIAVFIGANFVAVVFLTWMPTFLYNKFHMSLSMAGLNATVYIQIASVLGVISGGIVADALVKKMAGGRMLAQSVGLLVGVPFVFLTGWTRSIALLVVAMIGFGYFKGIYDANIFASLYDVVPVERRGAAAGILNSLGWLGAGFAPVAIAISAAHYGMSASISATAGIYVLIGLLLITGAARQNRKAPNKSP
ncbi:MAG TPA: MFS transporter [Candidatus Acidoferrales bacterium]|nr:MFS transporter [Candidatus Acidoferrales bacterium]